MTVNKLMAIGVVITGLLFSFTASAAKSAPNAHKKASQVESIKAQTPKGLSNKSPSVNKINVKALPKNSKKTNPVTKSGSRKLPNEKAMPRGIPDRAMPGSRFGGKGKLPGTTGGRLDATERLKSRLPDGAINNDITEHINAESRDALLHPLRVGDVVDHDLRKRTAYSGKGTIGATVSNPSASARTTSLAVWNKDGSERLFTSTRRTIAAGGNKSFQINQVAIPASLVNCDEETLGRGRCVVWLRVGLYNQTTGTASAVRLYSFDVYTEYRVSITLTKISTLYAACVPDTWEVTHAPSATPGAVEFHYPDGIIAAEKRQRFTHRSSRVGAGQYQLLPNMVASSASPISRTASIDINLSATISGGGRSSIISGRVHLTPNDWRTKRVFSHIFSSASAGGCFRDIGGAGVIAEYAINLRSVPSF